MQSPTRRAWDDEARAQALWAVLAEVFFLVAVLAVAAMLVQTPALLNSPGVRLLLRELGQTFAPFTGITPWYRLALAIFLHNTRALLLLTFASAVSAALVASPAVRGIGAVVLVMCLTGVALFWLANVISAGVVVAAAAHVAAVPPLLVWISLLPHGVFEVFALSWAMVLPIRLAWTWVVHNNAGEAAARLRDGLWPGVVVVVAVLALAATIEAGVSPAVLHALVPQARATLPQTANP